MLNATEILTVSEATMILKPFFDLTVQMSAEERPTANLAIPMTKACLFILNGIRPTQEVTVHLKYVLEEEARNRFNFETDQSFAIATFLDPRCKGHMFTDNR